MSTAADQSPGIRKSDKYIPWMVVAFFAVFIAVDAVMVTLAIQTQTGVITERAYEKGLQYNDTLEAAAQQETWGWNSDIEFNQGTITFAFFDDLNDPIEHAQVSAEIIRPIQSGHDFEINLEETAQGRYTAPLALPLPGEWKIRIYAHTKDRTYQASQLIAAP